ncbi:solute carrier family 23 protein [Pseudalkalibacillus berkeleyi]|uniref:NCS2 family nucleobase:cation symporter n=1 Tax=Pseudalkalibacillus berkeleyi TaxID=1069813 RepID=A0ABS9GZ38_9BACL|nr:solute carrier family 23 protein [Pseudalkalibacillus berkeleyi]MCF6137036.1 NCS2 family nucleobase:cation symporter [Pseudalkalibacillus berkeleyi]
MNQKEVGIREIPSKGKWLVLSFQHLFAMFGATILVPFLVGLNPAVALVSSGLGTLAYLLITKGQIPAYLGSSFAFIAPIILAKSLGGMEAVMVGSFLAGLVYGGVAVLIKTLGIKWLLQILPPVVVGPVIIVIGLGLATTAIDMAMYIPGSDPKVYSLPHFSAALVTLGITIIAAVFLKGFLNLIPVLVGIIGGYLYAYSIGLIDFTPVQEASWLQVPDLMIPFVSYSPTFSWQIALIMVPIAVVTITEHIGDQMVLSKVVGKNFIAKPGLHRSILGDGVATIIASCLGGPPNTTYGENIGVLAITRVFSVFVVGGAALLAIAFGFVGKITALISTIPTPVMGGVSILLFGIIASSGLRMLIDNKVDLGKKRNLVISSVILVLGVGGATLQITDEFQVASMALATITGILLNLLIPGRDKDVQNTSIFKEDSQNQSKEPAA